MRPRPSTLALMLAVAPASPLAQTLMPEVVVTGGSLPRPAASDAYGSTLIPADRLTSDASGRLEQVLRDVAGFQQFRRTDSRAANPTSQGATLRALGGNAASRALVLLDGAPQADPFAGWIPWPALAPGRLSAARLTSGGGAGPFGSGALTGVIELASASPGEAPRYEFGGAAGSRGSRQADAELTAAIGGVWLSVQGQVDRGDGYILLGKAQRGPVDVPARYDQRSLSLRAIAPLPGDLELQLRALMFDDDRRRGLVGAESESRGADVALRVIGQGRWPFEALVYTQDRTFSAGFLSVDAARETATPTLDQYDTPATGLGGKLEIRPPVGGGHDLQLGLDVRRAEGETRERFRFQAGGFTRLRRAGGDSLAAGAFIEDSFKASERLTLTGGLRLDRWRLTGGHLVEADIATGEPTLARAFADRQGWEPTARAGALLDAGPGVRLRAAAYANFRLPTLNELYRPFRVGTDATAANAGLRQERLRGFEAGVDLEPAPAVRLHATAFHNRLENAIANVTRGQGPATFPDVGFVGGAFRVRENLPAIDVSGLEASAEAALGEATLAAAYASTHARNDAPGLELDGLRPAQTPRHQASATLGWRGGERLRGSLTARYVSSQFEDDLERRRLAPALTLDATLRVQLTPTASLELRGENLADVKVEAGISGDGLIDRGTPRTLWIGLRVREPSG